MAVAVAVAATSYIPILDLHGGRDLFRYPLTTPFLRFMFTHTHALLNNNKPQSAYRCVLYVKAEQQSLAIVRHSRICNDKTHIYGTSVRRIAR